MSEERSLKIFAKGLRLGLFILVCDILSGVRCVDVDVTNVKTDVYVRTDVDFEEKDNLFDEKVEIFKRDILHKLGYARPPRISNMTKSIEENRRMIQQYKKYIEERNRLHENVDADQQDWEDMDNKIKSKMFYSVQHEGLIPRLVEQKDWIVAEAFRFFFKNLPSHPANDHNQELAVESAKLRIYVKDGMPENLKDKHTVDRNIRVNAYQVLSIQNKTTYSRTLLDSIMVNLDASGWISFDVSKAVQSWIDDRDSNLGVEIATESQNIHDVIDIDSTALLDNSKDSVISDNSTQTVPVLDIFAEQRHLLKRVKRRSRRRGTCRRKDKEPGCCRYPIKISFADIGWDWILAPLEYKGYYCAGSCTEKHKLASTFAGIKVQLHRQKPKRVPAPCCHAAKLSPFTILYFDDEKERYTFTDIADLVVEQCKCG